MVYICQPKHTQNAYILRSRVELSKLQHVKSTHDKAKRRTKKTPHTQQNPTIVKENKNTYFGKEN